MQKEYYEVLLIIGLCCLITFGIRLIPFVFLRGDKVPPMVVYLGRFLPPAIMMILIIYCLRSISFYETPYGIPELLSIGACLLMLRIRRDTVLSIAAGTLIYMMLIRLMI
ncbi:MAG TPA: AzlD domain-containing protein [Candidatus Avilachnospira avicola]|nr:AzlD domain-containing protein [Candidatus Avilachnospira avicola]